MLVNQVMEEANAAARLSRADHVEKAKKSFTPVKSRKECNNKHENNLMPSLNIVIDIEFEH